MNTDSRSQLERDFDDHAISANDLVKLVEILQKERDAWMANAKAWEKARLAAEAGQ